PINPADISFCRGTYRLKPTLPATPGAECVGRVTAVGTGVTHVKPGDMVINLQRENWTQQRRVKGDDVIAVSEGVDIQQAAMLRINPATALLLLTDLADLKSGDWVIQNVANSAVGWLGCAASRPSMWCGASRCSASSRRSVPMRASSTAPTWPRRSGPTRAALRSAWDWTQCPGRPRSGSRSASARAASCATTA